MFKKKINIYIYIYILIYIYIFKLFQNVLEHPIPVGFSGVWWGSDLTIYQFPIDYIVLKFN